MIGGQEVRNNFFLVEKPGFDVALIVGASAKEDILGVGNTVEGMFSGFVE